MFTLSVVQISVEADQWWEIQYMHVSSVDNSYVSEVCDFCDQESDSYDNSQRGWGDGLGLEDASVT